MTWGTARVAALATLALLGPAAAAKAANTIPVTSNADSGPGTLRAAVAAASPGDTITIPAMTITLTSGEIVLGKTLTIVGAGPAATTVSGGHVSRVFYAQGGLVEISRLTIADGAGKDAPADSQDSGGAVMFYGGAGDSLTLSDVAVTGSTAGTNHGGGVQNGGLGALTIRRSLLTGNSARDGGGLGVESASATASTTLIDSTVTGNTLVGSGGRGGGIYLNTTSSVQLVNDTIVGNSAGATGLGGALDTEGDHHLVTNTILAGNTGSEFFENCVFSSATSGGHNIQDHDDQCGLTGPTDQAATDPKLAPLADNGGPTKTFALLPGSPAIDAGGNAACSGADQRGVARPQNGVCDIGAFELVHTADLAATLTPSAGSVTVGDRVTLTAKVTNLGPQPATGVTLGDALPAGLTLVSAGSCTGSPVVSCPLGTLAPGASATVALVVTATKAGTITDSAKAAAAQADPSPANNTASTTIVVGAGPPPRLTALKVSRARFVLSARKPKISRAAGTTISFKLDRAAKVTLTFKLGKRTKGTLSFSGHAGANKVVFYGRLGTRRLKPGRYVLTAVAKDAAGNSAPRSVRLTALRR